jgi:hypothetical protein
LCEDAGFKLETVGHIDSTAARAMAMRRGLGKAKHISVQYLWLQGRIHSGDIVLQKVSTEKNLADLFTKPLTRPRVAYLLRGLGYVYADGRAEKAPWLEVDTAAISTASPLLALTVLAMRVGRASCDATAPATAYDDEQSSQWLLWTVVLGSMLAGMATLSVLAPLAKKLLKFCRRALALLLLETVEVGVQTHPYAVGASVHRVPDRIIATATGACYHLEGCSATRDPTNALQLRKGARYLRRCEVCGLFALWRFAAQFSWNGCAGRSDCRCATLQCVGSLIPLQEHETMPRHP